MIAKLTQFDVDTRRVNPHLNPTTHKAIKKVKGKIVKPQMLNIIKSHQTMHLGTITTIESIKTKITFKIMIEAHSIQNGQTKRISKDRMDGFTNLKIKLLCKIKLKETV